MKFLRALLYRRPSEPQSIEVDFDQAIYPVRIRRHRQARRYTLRIHAASREVILTMPPRGSRCNRVAIQLPCLCANSLASRRLPRGGMVRMTSRDAAWMRSV